MKSPYRSLSSLDPSDTCRACWRRARTVRRLAPVAMSQRVPYTSPQPGLRRLDHRLVPLHPPSCCCRLSCLPLPLLRRWKSLERTRLPELMGWVCKLFCSVVIYRTSPRCRGSSAQDDGGGSKHPVRGNAWMAGFKSGFQMLRAASGGLPNFVADLSIV